MGQQFFAVLRDEISVHIPSFKLWVARQFEEEVNVGVQPNNLGERKADVPSEWGKQHIQKNISMAYALSTKYFLLGITLRKNKIKRKNPLHHHYTSAHNTM